MTFDDEPPPEEAFQGGDEHGAPAGLYETPVIPSEPASRAAPLTPTTSLPPAEEHVIACCFLDQGETLTRATNDGVDALHFSHPALRSVWLALRTLQAREAPLTLESVASEMGHAANWPLLLQLTDVSRIPTTAHYSHFLRILKDDHLRRELSSATSLIADRAADDPTAVSAQIISRLTKATLAATPKKTPLVRQPLSFSLVPHSDSSVLLGNRYLNRGDGLVLSSQSGMGKSSIQAQMAKCFALSQPFHGIAPNGHLKSLILQSEDSDGDVAEVWQSMAHVEQWTPAQRDLLNQNVRIVTDRVNRGDRFLANLKALLAEFQPDLVWINPLQAFIDGDVTDSQDIGKFLREGLNSMNEPPRFGYVLIHHTTKPATGKERSERLWHEVMYDMAGGAEIINWARAIISLRPTDQEGEFMLRLAKRGRRAGVTKEVEQGAGVRIEHVTEIPLRHASGRMPGPDGDIPIIYWEKGSPPPERTKSRQGGRPASHLFEDYARVFPKKTDKGLPLNQLHRVLHQQRPINKDSLFRALRRWAEEGEVEIVAQEGRDDLYRKAL